MPNFLPVKLELKLGDDGVRTLSDFAKSSGSVVAGLCASALDMVIPQKRIWAFNNYKRVIEHYEYENAKRKEAGKKSIVPRFAHPAFQVIGDEDDDDMLKLWATLLANLQDGSSGIQSNRAFIGMLQSMEPIDARVLKWLCDTQRDDGNHPFVYINAKDASDQLLILREELLLSLHNLSRIASVDTVALIDMSGLLAVKNPENHGLQPGLAVIMFDTMYFRLTTLGVSLIDACRPVDDLATLVAAPKF